ncbi:MAG: hypothetical protein HZA93_05055 [Verrucomicrobia bacterium]|nr:hypothetical protein [Verrucomicrobiota bacterium]
MATKKMDKTAHEPGWGEVILGATLSVALGAVLGALALVFRPVAVVKETPKEPAKGVTYVVEGGRDTAKARQAAAKRKAFVSGQSVTVTEDELNSLLPALPASGAPPAGAKPKAGEKAPATKAPAPAAAAPAGTPSSDDIVAPWPPNLRIRDGVVQLIVPVTFNLLGLDPRVMVTATGRFVKKDGGFAFEPDAMSVGCCPLNRVPFAAGVLAKKFLTAKAVPEDIASVWPKVADVSIEGSALKITMP